MSPEILRGESNVTEKSDIYAFGLIIYHTLTRSPPFEEYPSASIPHQVLKGNRPKLSLPAIKPAFKTMLPRLWHSNPKKRPTALNVLSQLKTFETL